MVEKGSSEGSTRVLKSETDALCKDIVQHVGEWVGVVFVEIGYRVGVTGVWS